MTSTRSQAVAQQFFDALTARDTEALQATMADDVRLEFPFAPAGQPAHLKGSQAKEFLVNAVDAMESIAINNLVLTPDEAQSRVVAEGSGDMRARTGEAYANRYVWVLQVEAGLLAVIREYYNPLLLLSGPEKDER